MGAPNFQNTQCLFQILVVCKKTSDCTGNRYCNFRDESWGLCEPCSDLGESENKCENRRHNKGKESCKAKCKGL